MNSRMLRYLRPKSKQVIANIGTRWLSSEEKLVELPASSFKTHCGSTLI